MQPAVAIWKKAPFLRLLPFLAIGILLQWYMSSWVEMWMVVGALLLTALFAFSRLSPYSKFRFRWMQGGIIMLIFVPVGGLLTWYNNIQHNPNWLGHHITPNSAITAIIDEPLIEKNKSYKANVKVQSVINADSSIPVTGAIIVYFAKDSAITQQLAYGNIIRFKKRLQSIKNSGNPGAFNYEQFCLFNQITHQVYLTPDEWEMVTGNHQPLLSRTLQTLRSYLLNLLKTYIPGKAEAGVAEALLIGYRDDIDKDLLQAYTNTGVIHVIAISGMHLAMIYGLLMVLLKRLRSNAGTRWISGVIILSVLWLFTFLSGAGPSVLRSAIMFSFIVVGESFYRQVSIYHTLSASAFFLLCWNPFFLWDVGFQLSYAAVLSIVLYVKPITSWFYSKHKMVNHIWQLCAVTIAAQILTTPLSVYHFNQLPNAFLLSNIIIVPLSGLILYLEILLCIVAGLPDFAELLGQFVGFLIKCMNEYIQFINWLPHAVSYHLTLGIIQAVLLLMVLMAGIAWLQQRQFVFLATTLVASMVFTGIRLVDFNNKSPVKLVVYNVPGYTAIDVWANNTYVFWGNEQVEQDPYLRNFHLKPGRTWYRSLKPANERVEANLIGTTTTNVWYANGSFPARGYEDMRKTVVIVSGNNRLKMKELCKFYVPDWIIFDSSCGYRQLQQWKNECDSLLLRRHVVAENGAFLIDL